jgi:hypothetical protein
LNLIFSDVLNIDFKITYNQKTFLKDIGVKINYSKNAFPGTLQIIPIGLLDETKTREQIIESGIWKDIPAIFANNNPQVPFDLFSAVFYIVTRYEEYLPFNPDKHSRFEACESIAWKNSFLRLPVVDLWCKQLAKELGIEKECRGIQPDHYRFQLTIDIDQAWLYKHKGIFRSIAGFAKNLVTLNLTEIRIRLQVLTGRINDPAYTYDYLEQIQNRLSRKINYFILSGKRGIYDKNISLCNNIFKKLIERLGKQNIIGIHPSYASSRSFHLLKKEYKNLSLVVGTNITCSRQHYLKLKFPDTYRNLITLGIKEDYTMGYVTQNGFRAGISRPFFFYDLSAEKQTGLRIVPFQVMDRTLLSYLNLKTDEALKEIEYYFETISNVGGYFVTLWHNTSLSDQGEWKGWKDIFEKMIEMNTNI